MEAHFIAQDLAFRRQTWLQIYLPIIVTIIVIVTMVIAIAVLRQGGYSVWADILLILLVVPVLIIAAMAAVALGYATYYTIILIRNLPGPVRQGQILAAQLSIVVRAYADRITKGYIVPDAVIVAFKESLVNTASIFRKQGEE